MKRKLFFQIFLIIFISGLQQNKIKAQGYIPFPMDSANWRILLQFSDHFSCEEEYVFEYYFGGDTLLNNFNYKIIRQSQRLLFSHAFGSYNCSNYLNQYEEYYVRQDTNSKKVFIINMVDSTENLLYDFGLGISDTLYNSQLLGMCGTYDIVQSIDTILTGTVQRKRWNFYCISPIVEGIGSVYNPFAPPYIAYTLACVNVKDSMYYSYEFNQAADSAKLTSACSFSTSISDKNKFNRPMDVNYNSYHHELTFNIYDESLMNNIFQVEIFDVMGKKVQQKELRFMDQKLNRINISSISTGIYIVHMIDLSKNETMSKLIFINQY